MLGLPLRRAVAAFVSILIALLGLYELIDDAAPLLMRDFPSLAERLGVDTSNLEGLAPILVLCIVVFMFGAFLLNVLLWPVFRYLLGSKGGDWIYVVQNVRPRTFDAGEDQEFDALHGLSESQLIGHFKLRDGLFRARVPRAAVFYRKQEAEEIGDFRGNWKSSDTSVSSKHLRFKYGIKVERKLDGEKAHLYTGYYLLEPAPDVEPIFGGEVWEGVVFTVNRFGGLFGIVYAERYREKEKLDLRNPTQKILESIPVMFGRVRTPSREAYINN